MDLINIVDRESFRTGYRLINALESLKHDPKITSYEEIDKYIVGLKREVRKYSRKNLNERMAVWAGIVESRIAWTYGIDGYVELITFPDGYTLMETESLFKRHFKIDYYPTYYDCTGQAFTVWHKTFQRNGRYCIYHSVAFDV